MCHKCQEDNLNTARGIFSGIVGGILLWGMIFLAYAVFPWDN